MLALALSPLQRITARITAARVAKPGFVAGIPVICVGNVGVGGAGKTIVTLDLLARLQANAFALSRGYGGRLAGPVMVEPRHTARDVGDEALLLAARWRRWWSPGTAQPEQSWRWRMGPAPSSWMTGCKTPAW